KAAAEDDLRARDGLQWTIVRPGRLTDDPGVGLVALAPVGDGDKPRGKRRKPGAAVGEREDVTRDDVALVLAAILHEPRSAGLVLDLVAGDRSVDEALADVLPWTGRGRSALAAGLPVVPEHPAQHRVVRPHQHGAAARGVVPAAVGDLVAAVVPGAALP